MKFRTKLILAAAVTFVTAFLLLLFTRFAPADAGMALFLLLFFIGDPLAAIGLGLLAGTDLRRLWWLPLGFAAACLLGVLAVFQTMEVTFLVYAGLYLAVGAAAMAGMAAGRYLVRKRVAASPEQK